MVPIYTKTYRDNSLAYLLEFQKIKIILKTHSLTFTLIEIAITNKYKITTISEYQKL